MNEHQIRKILIANRGEIAARIIRTAKRMGIRTVAIFSEVDADSLHVLQADEAYCIGHSDLAETYLNIGKIISLAVKSGCDSVHPGYGFLAENPAFVKACRDAGLIFIGPDEKAMQIMGNKIEAREFVDSIGVPITKGLTGETAFLLQHAEEIGFPVLVKAAAGGGGKGMRIVHSIADLETALESTSREASSYFADGTVYIEKFIENPRHIEFQLLGDSYGNVIHLFERECSIQRRYQKIIEEAPSPTLNPEVRKKMGEAAVKIGKAIKYCSAGTIEFMVDSNLDFYFLEMNTRIQVEHPVTEMTTGIDIVEQQIHVASGKALTMTQSDVLQNGHAIECRIYAEEPEHNFRPSPGQMKLYIEPSGENIRVESAVSGQAVIHSFFDPMISKLVVWGADRDAARLATLDSLRNYIIHGIGNNIPYLSAILNHEVFIGNKISTKYCDEHSEELIRISRNEKQEINPLIPVFAALIASLKKQAGASPSSWERIGYWRALMQPGLQMEEALFNVRLISHDEHALELILDGKNYKIEFHSFPAGKLELNIDGVHNICWVSQPEYGKLTVSHKGHVFEVSRKDILPAQQEFSASEVTYAGGDGTIVSPMPGKVIKIAVSEKQQVRKGDLLLVVEAMKMENNIISPRDGIVERIEVELGEMVDGNRKLIHLE